GKHCARTLLLAAGNLVLGMRLQARIEDLFDFWMSIQMARYSDAVGIVLEHAHGQGFNAARNEEAIHGSEARTCGALDDINLFRILGTREHDRSARRIAVAVQ